MWEKGRRKWLKNEHGPLECPGDNVPDLEQQFKDHGSWQIFLS